MMADITILGTATCSSVSDIKKVIRETLSRTEDYEQRIGGLVDVRGTVLPGLALNIIAEATKTHSALKSRTGDVAAIQNAWTTSS